MRLISHDRGFPAQKKWSRVLSHLRPYPPSFPGLRLWATWTEWMMRRHFRVQATADAGWEIRVRIIRAWAAAKKRIDDSSKPVSTTVWDGPQTSQSDPLILWWLASCAGPTDKKICRTTHSCCSAISTHRLDAATESTRFDGSPWLITAQLLAPAPSKRWEKRRKTWPAWLDELRFYS